MATYAIGDIQGCAAELEDLLQKLSFDPGNDRLWLVGDLVNRGPDSLAVLRRIIALGDAAVTVLGNHDLHLLALRHGQSSRRDPELQSVLAAPDSDSLMDWLQSRPVLHHDPELQVTMLHAGLPPQWTLETARGCAQELQGRLRAEDSGKLFKNMYGNEPALWRDNLEGTGRLRFITNALTRLRVCDSKGRMRLGFKGPRKRIPKGCAAWFEIPWRESRGHRIVCGHWSALGYNDEHGVLSLDTGCVWGGPLTAQRIDVASAPISVPARSAGLPIDTAD